MGTFLLHRRDTQQITQEDISYKQTPTASARVTDCDEFHSQGQLNNRGETSTTSIAT